MTAQDRHNNPPFTRSRKELLPFFDKCVATDLYDQDSGVSQAISPCGKRVTRSVLKKCRRTFGSVAYKRGRVKEKPICNVMRPPGSVLSVHTRRKNSETSRRLNSSICHISKSVCQIDYASSTSDYGTLSEDSRNCSLEPNTSCTTAESCHCSSISGVDSLSVLSDDIITESGCVDNNIVDLSTCGWDSDSNDVENSVEWDSVAELEYYKHLRESTKVTLVRISNVTAIIPLLNRSDYKGDFNINVLSVDNCEYYRKSLCCSMRVHHVSPVISVEPHGLQFYESFPAILSIPLYVEPQDETWLSCLCSNTSGNQNPCWERLPKTAYSYRNGYVTVTASHFSLFTVILEEPYPEVMKHIRCRTGGRLRVDDVPGLQVEFPRGCLEQDVDAYLRVLFDREPHFQRESNRIRERRALASPVIMLGPHGYEFSPLKPPVQITLPVPDYDKIIARFPDARLSVWQSSTREDEPMVWEMLNANISEPVLITVNNSRLHLVTFPVHHFSFFKIVWDILASSLYEAKMGMSYFYPYISFSMMCQAFMEESKEDSRFGLEIICYRSDRRLPDTTNYRHRVGASLKPKMVRPGRIIVRLKSQMFEADVDAGEDADMIKEEPDFRGRDFEKQYACRFKPNINIERGTFGKVVVERSLGANKDPLFEFNLHKTGMESENSAPMGCDRWTIFAMKELASSLQITEGNNWKKFAQYIGFTKNEIKSKLQYSPDPFFAMMNLYNSRGGTPEEFTQALYAVSRDLRIGKSGLSGSNSDRSRSSHSAGSGSDSKASSSQGSASNSRGLLWGLRPWGRPKDSDSGEDSIKTDERGKKRSWSGSKKDTPGKASKRRKFSDVSETVTTSSSDDSSGGEDAVKSVSTDEFRKNTQKLTDKDLWKLSSKIASKDWKNLGRNLGIEEQVLQDLNHTHQAIGFRECTYQMLLEWKSRKPRKCTFGELYSALLSESMVSVAKHLVTIMRKNDGGDNDS